MPIWTTLISLYYYTFKYFIRVYLSHLLIFLRNVKLQNPFAVKPATKAPIATNQPWSLVSLTHSLCVRHRLRQTLVCRLRATRGHSCGTWYRYGERARSAWTRRVCACARVCVSCVRSTICSHTAESRANQQKRACATDSNATAAPPAARTPNRQSSAILCDIHTHTHDDDDDEEY